MARGQHRPLFYKTSFFIDSITHCNRLLQYHFNFTTKTNPPQLHINIDTLKYYGSLSVQNVGFLLPAC